MDAMKKLFKRHRAQLVGTHRETISFECGALAGETRTIVFPNTLPEDSVFNFGAGDHADDPEYLYRPVVPANFGKRDGLIQLWTLAK